MSEQIAPYVLAQLLHYDQEAGKLFWRHRPAEMFKSGDGRYTAERTCATWNARYAGKEAFTAVGTHGYACGAVFNKLLLAHRVVWALVTGEWPDGVIDHIDRDRLNNRFENLRQCTQAENSLNRVGYKTREKSSKFKGLWWHKVNKKWIVEFRGKHIGSFEHEHEAASAYDREAHAYCPEFSLTNKSIGGSHL